jgi:hypothetical protein
MIAMRTHSFHFRLSLMLGVLLSSCASRVNPFPFTLDDAGGRYAIVAEIESKELFSVYEPLFTKYGYSGNGYCWEGHIIQILEKLDRPLLEHIEFDPEAGAFFAYADTKRNQTRFVELLAPIFSDPAKLEPYVKAAERAKISD